MPALPQLKILARAKLPTRHGDFEIVSFEDEKGRGLDDIAIIAGKITGAKQVHTRVHSECLTGDVFGSARCDCREQLELALERIQGLGEGLILYMRQEGRGIGIAAKVGAYELQEQGFDTVDANLRLGFGEDQRSYETAAAMLYALEVESIILLTNNPAKIEGLRVHGINISEREPVWVVPGQDNNEYLETKRERMGHMLKTRS